MEREFNQNSKYKGFQIPVECLPKTLFGVFSASFELLVLPKGFVTVCFNLNK